MKNALLGLLTAGILACPMSAHAVLVGELEQTAPLPIVYVLGVDFAVFDSSAVGDVTATVQAVDLMLGLGNFSNSGCEAGDFAGFVAGRIALIQRGTCTFELKAENAAAAGASGVLIFNQGNTDGADRQGLFVGTLGTDYTGGIPVISLSYPTGAAFSMTPGLIMHMVVRDVPVVPEPGALGVLAFGLVTLGLRSARRPA